MHIMEAAFVRSSRETRLTSRGPQHNRHACHANSGSQLITPDQNSYFLSSQAYRPSKVSANQPSKRSRSEAFLILIRTQTNVSLECFAKMREIGVPNVFPDFFYRAVRRTKQPASLADAAGCNVFGDAAANGFAE